MRAQAAFGGQRVFRVVCRCKGAVLVSAAARQDWRCDKCRSSGTNSPSDAIVLDAGGAIPDLEFLRPAVPLVETHLRDQLAREGASRAQRSAGDVWRDRARAVVVQLARARPELTSDDVWAAGLERPAGASGRALGAVMTWAARQGFIAKTDRVVRSASPSSHGDPMTIWRSLAHQPEHPL